MHCRQQPPNSCPFAPIQLSTVLGAAIPKEREHNGWIEGVAIWVAVFVVTGVGEYTGPFSCSGSQITLATHACTSAFSKLSALLSRKLFDSKSEIGYDDLCCRLART